jgi:hypothetical protein
MPMKSLKKQNIDLFCGLASAVAFALSSSPFALSAPLPSGGYTSGSGAKMPLELFDIAQDSDSNHFSSTKFTFPNFMKYAGFVGGYYNPFNNTVSHWIFPENPAELQFRPLFLAMDSNIMRVQFNSGRGIQFGYMIDDNIAVRSRAEVYCEDPGILADGKMVATSHGNSRLIQKNSQKVISLHPFFTAVNPPQVHLITSAKVVEYTTCGASSSGPKRTHRLTAREHQQFKRLVGYLADVTGNPYLRAAASGKPITPVK